MHALFYYRGNFEYATFIMRGRRRTTAWSVLVYYQKGKVHEMLGRYCGSYSIGLYFTPWKAESVVQPDRWLFY